MLLQNHETKFGIEALVFRSYVRFEILQKTLPAFQQAMALTY